MRDDNESSINLEDAYALETPEDNRALYRNWASTYDADFALRNKYVYPKSIATICASLVNASSPLTILDIGCGTGIVGAPECGDVMKLQIKVNPLTGLIEDAKFKTFGCGSAIASSSLATEWVKGKSLDAALGIRNTEIVEELALPPVKVHCSVLAEDAIKAAIKNLQDKQAHAPQTVNS
jgi:nitrogen fixation NifU-like protein